MASNINKNVSTSAVRSAEKVIIYEFYLITESYAKIEL